MDTKVALASLAITTPQNSRKSLMFLSPIAMTAFLEQGQNENQYCDEESEEVGSSDKTSLKT